MQLAAELPWRGWQKVGALMGRPPESCRTQWHNHCACSNHGGWSPEEDGQLRAAADHHGLRNVCPSFLQMEVRSDNGTRGQSVGPQGPSSHAHITACTYPT